MTDAATTDTATTDVSTSPSGVPLPTPDDVQGWVVNGYRFRFVRHMVFTIRDAAPVRAHLDAATSGAEGVTQIHDARRWDVKPDHVLSVGFTHSGLRAMGVGSATLDAFPTEFRAGAAERALKIGDYGPSSPDHWDDGMGDTDRVHMIWTCHGRSHDDVQGREDELAAAFGSGAQLVQRYDGEGIYDGDEPTDKVHFGYVDGISQPRIEGFTDGTQPDNQPVSPAGAFFAGHESQFEGVVFDLPQPIELTGNGTYNAFRVLEQDVFAFERYLQEMADRHGVEPEWIAAKFCGRWRNGNPLPLDPDGTKEPLPADEINDYGYLGDADGTQCPMGSHMRRANPRDSPVVQRASPHTRRILRRGMPYGPAIELGQTEPDGTPRGLLGNFMCGSLVSQFEGIMYDWINLGLQHPDITGLNDPVLGANDEEFSRFVIPGDDGDDVVLDGFPRFIRTRAAAYTFLPSLTGLRHLARL